MRNLSYKSTLPLAGTHVRAFCAGLRGAKYAAANKADVRDYREGWTAFRALPRRLAKKRATRILHEHRMNARRWSSRGNMAAATAQPSSPRGFVRFLSHVKEEGLSKEQS